MLTDDGTWTRISRRHFVVLSGTNLMEKIGWRVVLVIFLPNKRSASKTTNKKQGVWQI